MTLARVDDTRASADSDMTAQAFKDPYLLDFQGNAEPRREAEPEKKCGQGETGSDLGD